MKWALSFLLSIIAFVLGTLGAALAHEEEIHIGDMSTGIPVVVAWIAGGGIAVVFLLLLIGWAVSRRRLQRRGPEETEKQTPMPSERHEG